MSAQWQIRHERFADGGGRWYARRDGSLIATPSRAELEVRIWELELQWATTSTKTFATRSAGSARRSSRFAASPS